MPDPELMRRFQRRLRYQQARSWQKPLLDPGRFVANQLRKYGVPRREVGSVYGASTFYLPEFSVVEGEMVSQEIASYSVFEPALTAAFLHLVQPGQVVLDIGMHLGYYATLFAVLVGSEGRVHAFEPTPSTRELARRNTDRFPQIAVHPLALWSSSGTLSLRDYGVKWMGWNSLRTAKLDEEPVTPKQIDVKTTTLDEFRGTLPENPRVALIKIDAESAERDIIAGGKGLLRKDQPLISVEVGDHQGSKESRRLVEDLRALDYMPWEFKGGQFVPHQPRNQYTYDNLVFAPDSAPLNQQPAGS